MCDECSFGLGKEDQPYVDPNAETQICPSPVECDDANIATVRKGQATNRDNGIPDDINERLEARYALTPYCGGIRRT